MQILVLENLYCYSPIDCVSGTVVVEFTKVEGVVVAIAAVVFIDKVVVELFAGFEVGVVDIIATVDEFNGGFLVVWLVDNITTVVSNNDASETGFTVVKFVIKVIVTKDEFGCIFREDSVVLACNFIDKSTFNLGLFCKIFSVVLAFKITIVWFSFNPWSADSVIPKV